MIFWKNSLKCLQAKIEFEFIQLLYINQTIHITKELDEFYTPNIVYQKMFKNK